MSSAVNRILIHHVIQPDQASIMNDRHNSLHYMRKITNSPSPFIARLAGEDALHATGTALQNTGAFPHYGALVKRLRLLRRQASEGYEHYDLCEHHALIRYMRVFKRKFADQNRIFYQVRRKSEAQILAQL